GLSAKFKHNDVGIMPAERCAEHAVRAFVRRSEFYVPGALNRMAALAMKLVPHSIVVGQIARMYEGGFSSSGKKEEIAIDITPRSIENTNVPVERVPATTNGAAHTSSSGRGS